MTQNVEDTLMFFGESITLHHFLYENEKRYDSTESRLWADVNKETTKLTNFEYFQIRCAYHRCLMLNLSKTVST